MLERQGIGYADEKAIFLDKIRIPFTEDDIEPIEEEMRLGTLTIRVIGTCNINVPLGDG